MRIVWYAGDENIVETIVPPPVDEEDQKTHPFVELMIIIFCFIVAVCAMIAGAVGNYFVAGISVTLALFFVIIMLGYRGVIGQRQ
jgi:uncharacterized oligopeptide transporter (OPT) family protein